MSLLGSERTQSMHKRHLYNFIYIPSKCSNFHFYIPLPNLMRTLWPQCVGVQGRILLIPPEFKGKKEASIG